MLYSTYFVLDGRMEVKKLLNELQYKYADRIPLQYNKDFAYGMVILMVTQTKPHSQEHSCRSVIREKCVENPIDI